MLILSDELPTLLSAYLNDKPSCSEQWLIDYCGNYSSSFSKGNDLIYAHNQCYLKAWKAATQNPYFMESTKHKIITTFLGMFNVNLYNDPECPNEKFISALENACEMAILLKV